MDKIYNFMYRFIVIISILLFSSPIFSQSTNTITLEECLNKALELHPLQSNREILSNSLELKNTITDLSKLPQITWNSQARIQSENISLEIDNPMFPSIEIPIYSAKSTLDMEYMIYDGGYAAKQKKLNLAINTANITKLDIEIDKIKAAVIQNYLGILMTVEKEKVLENSLARIKDNIRSLEAALKHGVLQKQDILQLEVKAKAIENKLYANKEDKKAFIKMLISITGLDFEENVSFLQPQMADFKIDDQIEKKELNAFDNELNILSHKGTMIDLGKKPKIFAFASSGVGYPNPLNFFDDEISLYAIGGIGMSWKFYDWGKVKKEKQLIKLNQEIVRTNKENLTEQLNRYNDKYKIGVEKYTSLIEKGNELLEMQEEISRLQQSKLENGVILPIEYLNTLNDIIDTKLTLSTYKLEQIKVKLEYMLLKGKL